MARKVIPHNNYISEHINDLVRLKAPESSYEIYCKRFHTIKIPTENDCNNCPYFSGLLQGYGHQCNWEDIVPVETTELEIPSSAKQKEFLRVSKLIDRGLLKKG